MTSKADAFSVVDEKAKNGATGVGAVQDTGSMMEVSGRMQSGMALRKGGLASVVVSRQGTTNEQEEAEDGLNEMAGPCEDGIERMP